MDGTSLYGDLDLRYSLITEPLAWLKATAQTGLTGDKTGSFNLTTTAKGKFGSTYQAVLGDDIGTWAGYFTDGGTQVYLANATAGITAYKGLGSSAGIFTDLTNYIYLADGTIALYINNGTNVVSILDGTYAINATGDSLFTGDLTTTGTGTFGSVVIPTVFTAMTEPSGFVDRTATLSFVDATRVFTITGNHDIYINGVKTSKTTTSITIDDATGMNWVYYNASGVLSQATSIPSFALPLIATVYYNTVTDKGLLGEERHGIKMDGDTHHLLHNTVGTRYESGLAGTFGDTTFSIALGVIDDEDLEHTITPAKTTCNILYKDGAADFKWLAGQTVYYYTSGGNLYYNNGNTLTAMDSNKYVAYWIFATNDTTTPIVSLMGQRQDTAIADARTNNKYESLTLGTLPYQEMKLLYRVILRNDATPYEEVQDLRTVSNLPAGTYVATDHGVLTGLTDDDHSQYWLSGVSGRTDNYTTTGTLGAGAITGTSSLTTSTPTTLSAAELDRLDGLAGIITTDTTACTDLEGVGLAIDTAVLKFAPAEVIAPTWGAGAQQVWTFDLATDYTVTWTTGLATFSGDITVSGGDIKSGNISFTIGDATTDNITFVTDGTGDAEMVFPTESIEAGAYAAAGIDGDDVNSNIAGRSLTLTAASPDTLDADAELYTDFKGMTIETPTDADNFFAFEAPVALTITRVTGIVEAATSAVLTWQECDAAGDNCSTIEAVTADVDGTISTSIDNASIDAGDIIRLDVGTVTGTVGQAHSTITFTKND